MPNFYKKMIEAYKSRSLIDQKDDAFRNPYNLKLDKEQGSQNMTTPGDVSTTGLGSDFMDKFKPPDGWSAVEERSLAPKWQDSFDGNDPDFNDQTLPMSGGSGFYSDESPLGSNQTALRKLKKENRDISEIGPHNQNLLNNRREIFDNLNRRLN